MVIFYIIIFIFIFQFLNSISFLFSIFNKYIYGETFQLISIHLIKFLFVFCPYYRFHYVFGLLGSKTRRLHGEHQQSARMDKKTNHAG